MYNRIYVYNNSDEAKSFKFATLFIKIIAFCIALLVLCVSRYSFVFFSSAMLPTIIAIFADRGGHKCASATVCTFNLIGVLPYITRLWNSNSMNEEAKSLIVDVNTWLVIYALALVGQLAYWALPNLFARLYIAKARVQVNMLTDQRNRICADWGIKSDEPKRDLL